MDSSHNILVNIDTKGPCDLLRDPRRAEPGIAAFHLQYELGEFGRWSLGPWLSSSVRGVEEPVLVLFELGVESQDCRRSDDDG